MNLLHPARCALATVQPTLRMLPWAAVFDSADRLLSACGASRFEAVFADFGPLSDGCSGTRLVRTLGNRFPQTRVYLLSSQPELHRGWGRSCGAAGVLARDLPSLSQVLVLALEECEPPKPHDEVSTMSSQFSSTTEVDVRRLEQRLNEAIGWASRCGR